ncbi:hypothetical protein A2U01_0079713, partial [Trifolium medium]|nr:hypothetical protein [Trifolium medium]
MGQSHNSNGSCPADFKALSSEAIESNRDAHRQKQEEIEAQLVNVIAKQEA